MLFISVVGFTRHSVITIACQIELRTAQPLCDENKRADVPTGNTSHNLHDDSTRSITCKCVNILTSKSVENHFKYFCAFLILYSVTTPVFHREFTVWCLTYVKLQVFLQNSLCGTTSTKLRKFINSLGSLSCDRSVASSKASPRIVSSFRLQYALVPYIFSSKTCCRKPTVTNPVRLHSFYVCRIFFSSFILYKT